MDAYIIIPQLMNPRRIVQNNYLILPRSSCSLRHAPVLLFLTSTLGEISVQSFSQDIEYYIQIIIVSQK
jgi:hypothetical protein